MNIEMSKLLALNYDTCVKLGEFIWHPSGILKGIVWVQSNLATIFLQFPRSLMGLCQEEVDIVFLGFYSLDSTGSKQIKNRFAKKNIFQQNIMHRITNARY